MPTARGDVASISTEVSGRQYNFLIGGFSTDFCNGDSMVESYDKELDAWTVHSDLLLGRADMALGVIDSHIFVIGGETVNDECSRSVPVSDVERLDAGTVSSTGTEAYTSKWEFEEDVPSTRFRFVGASYKRSIFLFGGQATYTDNLDGQNGGFPIENTTMLYVPAEYRNNSIGTGLQENAVDETETDFENSFPNEVSTADKNEHKINKKARTIGIAIAAAFILATILVFWCQRKKSMPFSENSTDMERPEVDP